MKPRPLPTRTPAAAIAAWLVLATGLLQIPFALAATCALLTLLLAFAWRAQTGTPSGSAVTLRRPAWPRHAGHCLLGHGGPWQGAHSVALHAASDPRAGLAGAPARQRRPSPVEVDARLLGRNVLALGSPGCGKTSLLVLLARQAQRRAETVLVIDPKGSRALRDQLAAGARTAGRLFFCLVPDDPAITTCYDPLRHCTDAGACADRLGALLGDGKHDPFREFSRGVLAVLCEGLLAIGERPSLARLAELLPDAGAALLAADSDTSAEPAHSDPRRQAAWTALRNLASHDRAHYRKMCASLLPLLTLLTSGPAARRLATPVAGELGVQLDLWRCRAQGATLYVGVDALAQPQFARALVQLLLADLAAEASHAWRHGQHPAPLQLMVDEAGEVACEPLLRLLGKGREAGIRVMLAVQTLSDLEWRLDSAAAARVALGNVPAWFLFRQLDAHSREESSARLGELPLARATAARSVARNRNGLRLGRSASWSASSTMAPAARVPPATFGALRDGECLAQLPDGNLYHLQVPFAAACFA